MNIAFWSPLHGCGTTSVLLAVAEVLETAYKKRCLLAQTHFCGNSLAYAILGGKSKRENLSGLGIDALTGYFKGAKLTANDIHQFTVPVSAYTELLPGTGIISREMHESRLSLAVMSRLYEISGQQWDFMLTDVNAGDAASSVAAVEKADVTVVVLRQSVRMLEGLKEHAFLTGKKVFYVLADYDSASRFSIGNLRKEGAGVTKRNSGYLPYSTGLFDAMESGSVREYFREAERITEGCEADFLKCAQKLAGDILTYAMST